MKKVVILSAFLSPFRSGAEACAEEVPLALADQFDFTIVTARMRRDLPKTDMLHGKIPVIRVGFGCTFDKWLYPFLTPRVVRKLNPDTVHAVLETFAGLALTFCNASKKILTCQTTNRSFLKGYIIRKADQVTAISRILIDVCTQLGRSDVVLIPNGIPLSALRSAMVSTPKEDNSILFVGRLEKWKGVDTLLTAFAALPNNVAQLRIVGDGSQRSALETLARDLGIQDRVTFTGYLPLGEVEKEYARAQIFCGLSRSEALGNVFLEAQAAGCAVIGTAVGGIPDSVTHEQTGLLVAPNNAKAATDALQKLLTDSDARRRLTEAGKAHAQQYDWSAIAQRYAMLY